MYLLKVEESHGRGRGRKVTVGERRYGELMEAADDLWCMTEIQDSKAEFGLMVELELQAKGFFKYVEGDSTYLLGYVRYFDDPEKFMEELNNSNPKGPAAELSWLEFAHPEEIREIRMGVPTKLVALAVLGLLTPEESEVLIDAVTTALELSTHEDKDEEEL